MDLIDRLHAIATRAREHSGNLQTEEATKMALVVPFIEALGYSTWNPTEVVPEFIADVPMKKGEKVDYAIMSDGRPIMLIECKHVGVDLDKLPLAQLRRYFHVTEARVGVVTDGLVYRFYSDLEAKNVMDTRAFLEFDIRKIDEGMASELKRFAKSSFDLDSLLVAAEEMKYTRAIRKLLVEEFADPSEDLVRHLTKQVYAGSFTQAVKDKFHPIVRRALRDFVNDRIEHRLTAARELEELPPAQAEEVVALAKDRVSDHDVVTTQEEIDAYLIVKAIVREVLPADRVHLRDGKTYCSVLADDNNRKPICRLWFNAKSKRYVGVFDGDRNETKEVIGSLDDLYGLADQLKATALGYA